MLELQDFLLIIQPEFVFLEKKLSCLPAETSLELSSDS